MSFVGQETLETCRGCREVLTKAYWRVNGDVVCEHCMESERRDARSHEWVDVSRGLRAGLLSAGLATLAEAVAWRLVRQSGSGGLAFTLHAPFEIAVALLSGLIVGLAVRQGSAERGGWRLQVIAVGLVYAAYLASVGLAFGRSSAEAATLVERAAAASLPYPGRSEEELPRGIDALFGMGLAWYVNRPGQRVAISGPFAYGRRRVARHHTPPAAPGHG